MIKKNLGLDEKDIKIISYYIENPLISQNDIAEKLGLSQPSVFVRVQKLKKKGLLENQVGINFNKTKLFLTRVDLTSRNPNTLLEDMKGCPFFVNGYIMSGENNVSIMLVHENLKKIDDIINTHIRHLSHVTDIKVNVVVSSAKDTILPLDLSQEINPNQGCSDKCLKCSRVGTTEEDSK
jgi:Lrp/AsnC family transcriptional regulator, leucine-responsive regulatory protein